MTNSKNYDIVLTEQLQITLDLFEKERIKSYFFAYFTSRKGRFLLCSGFHQTIIGSY